MPPDSVMACRRIEKCSRRTSSATSAESRCDSSVDPTMSVNRMATFSVVIEVLSPPTPPTVGDEDFGTPRAGRNHAGTARCPLTINRSRPQGDPQYAGSVGAESHLVWAVVDDPDPWAESYIRQAALAPHLNRDEALVLLRKVAQGNDEARSDLMTAGRRIVVSNARRYVPSHGDLASVLRFGEQGLRTAIDRFDETKGFAFQTYATWWIQQTITRGAPGNLGGVREPLSPQPQSPFGTVHLDVPGTAS